MRIPFKENMAVAQKILARVQRIGLPKELAERGSVEAYSNGREQGYHINVREKGGFRGVSFSENRNSDSIVIYFANECTDFSMQGNVPDEKVYRNATYMNPGDYDGAARFIIDFLLGK